MKTRLRKTRQWGNWTVIIDRAKLFPVTKHTDELMALHRGRRSRGLVGRTVSSSVLIECNGQDANMRSRAVELRIYAFRLSESLARANRAMRDFLIAEGWATGPTQKERDNAADSIIQRGLRIEGRVDEFIAICDMLTNDVDQTGYTLKRLSDLIVIASKPELSV